MKKQQTIGNIVWMLLFVSGLLYADPQFSVRVLDMQGTAIEQVAAGQPFMIQVAVTQAPRSMSQPTIADIAQYNGYCSGVQMTTINGKSNSTYTYVLRIDAPGVYRIGPISAVYDGQQKDLDPVKVTVSTETRQNQTAAKMVNAAKAQYSTALQLTVDKERVYVGEPVSVRLRFLYNSPHITLRHINEPAIKNIGIDSVSEAVAGKQLFNGVQHEYVEWTWRLWPTTEGIITIPAYGAQYEIVNPHTTKQSGMNFFMFFQPNPVKATYSNAVTLVVDPVPEYEGNPVDAVGSFDALRAEINPAVLKVGQAAVFTLAVEGDAHFAALACPALRGMPNGVRWYPSKEWIEQKDADTRIKYFEYVLHAHEAGDWEIPAQTYTFFDPHTRSIDQIESSPQCITVVHDPAAAMHTQQSLAPTSSVLPQTDHSGDRAEQMPSTEAYGIPLADGAVHAAQASLEMPWWIFWLLFAVPFMLQSIWSKRGVVYTSRMLAALRKRYAFFLARRALRKAARTKNTADIYTLLTALLCRRRPGVTHESTHDYLEKTLADYLPYPLHERWHAYMHALAASVYLQQPHDSHLMWHEMDEWLCLLEKGGL